MTRDDRFKQFEFADSTPVRRWRFPWKWLLILIVLAAVAGYVYVFEQPRIEQALTGTPLERPPTVTQAYKWRDAEGNWNITDKPPASGVEYDTMHYRSDANVLPALPVD